MNLFDIFGTAAGPGVGIGLVSGTAAVVGLYATKAWQDRFKLIPAMAERAEVRREARDQARLLNSTEQGHRKNGQFDFKNLRDGSL